MKNKQIMYITAAALILVFVIQFVSGDNFQPILVATNQTTFQQLWIQVRNTTAIIYQEVFDVAPATSATTVYLRNLNSTYDDTVNYSVLINDTLNPDTWTLLENETEGYFGRGSQHFGEMWNYSSGGAPWTFPIPTVDVYHNMTGLVPGFNNGFKFYNNVEAQGGSFLETEHSGLYHVNMQISFQGSLAGGDYGISLGHNWDQTVHRNCYTRRVSSASAGSASVTCIVDLIKGDNITMMIEQETAPAKDIMIHTININLVRLGDISGLSHIPV